MRYLLLTIRKSWSANDNLHTTNKVIKIEHSQFGEFDRSFTHQIEHSVTIWRNDERQRERWWYGCY